MPLLLWRGQLTRDCGEVGKRKATPGNHRGMSKSCSSLTFCEGKSDCFERLFRLPIRSPSHSSYFRLQARARLSTSVLASNPVLPLSWSCRLEWFSNYHDQRRCRQIGFGLFCSALEAPLDTRLLTSAVGGLKACSSPRAKRELRSCDNSCVDGVVAENANPDRPGVE